MSIVKQFHYISKEESQMVLESINIKHKVIVLLMLDAGLRISEVQHVKNFDFKIEISQSNQQKKEEQNT
jgi:integrase